MTLTDNQNCFGCGRHNPISLKLHFERDGDTNRAEFTPGPQHESYAGITHGGILSTVMDEAMAWVLWDQGLAVIAGRMETRFRAPAVTGEKLCVEGWVEKRRGRTFLCGSRLSDSTGKTVAEASATFVLINERTG